MLALCIATLGLALRIVLWWCFGREAGVALGDLGWILPAGLAADAVQCVYFLTPFALYITLLPDRWYRSRWNHHLLAVGSLLTLFGIIYLAAAEYFFFEEFSARFNLVAVDYLAYPNEVMGDVWQEYPVVGVVLLSAATAGIIFRALRGHLLKGLAVPAHPLRRALLLAGHGLVLVLLGVGFQTDSLAGSANRVANELAVNGASSFFRSLRTLDLDYRSNYRTLDRERALALLGSQLAAGGGRFVDLASGDLTREFPANPAGLGRMNVVVVAIESFGAEFSRLHGSDRDLTPRFDALAAQSLWFSNAYASGTRTVRGLEAISASFPPIPSVAILRRPGNEHIATWGRAMADNGYRTSFLYGGYGYFDNMNHFFGENGFTTLDRTSFRHVRFANIWGVSDQDLFAQALDYYDSESRRGQPFFSLIMTTSNHKPYTFPAGVPGVPVEGGGRQAGVRYADHAIGEFIAAAARHPWFKDTLFVVVADHGARVYGSGDIPMRSYRIPLLVYAPGKILPRRVDALMGQIDIAPTVLGLLGLPYRAPFFGQDVLANPGASRVVLLSHNHDVALYRDGRMAVLGLNGRVSTIGYDPLRDEYHPLPSDRNLEDLAVAYYQVATDLFRTHRYL